MKRGRRFVGRPAAVLSLLVCAATAVLWVRSYFVMDELFLIYNGEGSEELSSLHGQIRIKHTLPRTGSRGGVARVSHRANAVGALPPRPWAEDRLRTKWGVFRYDYTYRDATKVAQAKAAINAFSSGTGQPQNRRQLMITAMQAELFLVSQPPETYRAFTFPIWLILLPTLLLLIFVWLIPTLRGLLRARAGRCRSCGYDLTGNTSGICPECGGVVNLAAKATV